MLFVPLPFVVALLLVLLIPRVLAERDDSPAPAWFAALLGLYALLAVLVGLRWGYDLRRLLPLQSVLAACWAPLAWLAFTGVGRAGAFFALRRDWPHLLPPVVVVACVALWPAPIDLLLIAVFAGYGTALLVLWRRGPDALPAVRLGELTGVHRALGITALALIAFAGIDVLISLDLRVGGGRHAERIVTWATLPMLLLVGFGASVAGVGRAAGTPADIAHASERPATSAASTDDANATDASSGQEGTSLGEGHDPAEDRAVLASVRETLRRDGLHRDADLTLERIARRSLVPARRVSGAINRLTGDSVSRYVNRLRLEDVRRALVDTDESITEIMLAAGFRTKSNFNRVFREAEGNESERMARRTAGRPVAAPDARPGPVAVHGDDANLRSRGWPRARRRTPRRCRSADRRASASPRCSPTRRAGSGSRSGARRAS